MKQATKFSKPGPWNAEPDELDWTDEKTGMACRIIRHPTSGHLCGYVQVPAAHPLNGIDYGADLPESVKPLMDSVMEGTLGKRGAIDVLCMAMGTRQVGYLFDVHGGITFSGTLADKDGHWYGFDCAHCDDLSPGMTRYGMGSGEYRDLEYVKAECASLAKQLFNVSA